MPAPQTSRAHPTPGACRAPPGPAASAAATRAGQRHQAARPEQRSHVDQLLGTAEEAIAGSRVRDVSARGTSPVGRSRGPEAGRDPPGGSAGACPAARPGIVPSSSSSRCRARRTPPGPSPAPARACASTPGPSCSPAADPSPAPREQPEHVVETGRRQCGFGPLLDSPRTLGLQRRGQLSVERLTDQVRESRPAPELEGARQQSAASRPCWVRPSRPAPGTSGGRTALSTAPAGTSADLRERSFRSAQHLAPR